MRPQLSVVDGIDPKLTQAFLLNQTGITEAEVWFTRGKLKARVIAIDSDLPQESRLKEACATVLGEPQAPAEIDILAIRNRVA